MKQIQDKIKELVVLGECEDYDKFNEHMAKQENLFTELKVLAKKNKTLLGRVIGLGVADGEAKYVVTKVNKKSVSTQFIHYCDGYSDWSLGRGKGNMPLHQAKAFIEFEDIFDK